MSMEYCRECDNMIDLDYSDHDHFIEQTKKDVEIFEEEMKGGIKHENN